MRVPAGGCLPRRGSRIFFPKYESIPHSHTGVAVIERRGRPRTRSAPRWSPAPCRLTPDDEVHRTATDVHGTCRQVGTGGSVVIHRAGYLGASTWGWNVSTHPDGACTPPENVYTPPSAEKNAPTCGAENGPLFHHRGQNSGLVKAVVSRSDPVSGTCKNADLPISVKNRVPSRCGRGPDQMREGICNAYGLSRRTSVYTLAACAVRHHPDRVTQKAFLHSGDLAHVHTFGVQHLPALASRRAGVNRPATTRPAQPGCRERRLPAGTHIQDRQPWR